MRRRRHGRTVIPAEQTPETAFERAAPWLSCRLPLRAPRHDRAPAIEVPGEMAVIGPVEVPTQMGSPRPGRAARTGLGLASGPSQLALGLKPMRDLVAIALGLGQFISAFGDRVMSRRSPSRSPWLGRLLCRCRRLCGCLLFRRCLFRRGLLWGLVLCGGRRIPDHLRTATDTPIASRAPGSRNHVRSIPAVASRSTADARSVPDGELLTHSPRATFRWRPINVGQEMPVLCTRVAASI